jgi:hypothetical protein
VANGEAAFVGEAEASGDVFREEGSGGEIVVEEERESVLNAGDAAPDGEEVVALFEIGRGRRVVGADGVDFASEEFLAEGVEGGLGAQGSIRRTQVDMAQASPTSWASWSSDATGRTSRRTSCGRSGRRRSA